MMRTNIIKTAALTLLFGGSAFAGPATTTDYKDSQGKTVMTQQDPTPLDTLTLDESYVFKSKIKFAEKGVGSGSELHSDFQYIRRVPITGNWYFQMGVGYDRFDFTNSHDPRIALLPDTLQTLDVPIGISYIVDDHIGFLAEVRPGIHFQQGISSGSFDVPFDIGTFYPIIKDKLYIVVGLATSILRQYPVLPDIGVVWVINDKLQLLGYAPEPKLIYHSSDKLAFWVGGEFFEQGYSTDTNNAAPQTKGSTTNGSVVDYTEYRAGAGVTYTPVKHWDINLVGGYSLERQWEYYRSNKTYTADPAPYVRFQVSAEF